MPSNCQHPGSAQVMNLPGVQVPARLSNCAHWPDAREGRQYVSFAPPKEKALNSRNLLNLACLYEKPLYKETRRPEWRQ
jgi:hypothetical protein